MNHRITTIGQLAIAAVALGAAGLGAAPTNSIYLRYERQDQSHNRRGYAPVDAPAGAATSLAAGSATGPTTAATSAQAAPDAARPMGAAVTTSIKKASWITVDKPSPKDIRVHDLVTIIVHEVSKHTTTEDTKAEREYTIETALQDWIRLNGGKLRPDKQPKGDPKIGFEFNREFEGKGDIKRQDSLSARIQAEVIDVMPNGNLILEATHTVVTNEEKTYITLTGVCRSKDVGADNTIMSSQLARLDISKHHEGVARDANKRGLLSGLIDWMAIF
ncbi:MAG: flagellar basal body L-ring protein FlgH [Sedimentisphaerales bacterium]|nr:flagellar basal body L-ring protein FlgH [Sedimentisphaerales bacterium]